jgi:hypothetical protein
MQAPDEAQDEMELVAANDNEPAANLPAPGAN